MSFKIFQSAGETGRDAFAIARCAKISGNSDDADDDAMVIAHRQLGRQTPTRASMSVPMKFQMIDNGAPGADNSLVLIGVKLREFFGEYLLYVATEKFLLIAATTAINQGLIDSDVTATSIFDEKCGVRNVVEELLDDG
jgi:hypothetical protein